jgi:SPP1 gp7 family putative phage head morphogenesis protein
MIRYRLADLVPNRRKGTAAQLPVITGTLRAEREYLKALRTILREMARETRENIVPLAVAEITANRAMMRDVDRSWFQMLIGLSVRLGITAQGMVERILGLEAQRHTDKFMQTAKQALGIDLAAVVRQEDLGDYLKAAGLRNAGLITGLAEDTVKRVQQTVTNAVINGKSAADLRAELTRQFNIQDGRARLIARDQIAKTTSDLNRIRHQQAGVTSYTWRTSADERVRDLHARLEGKVYKYGEPTGAEQGLPPGQPIQCRCIAQAIVEF